MRLHLLAWLLSALAFMATAFLIPGFKVRGFFSALVAALVFSIFSSFFWWVTFWITLPLTIVTLGIFRFFINAIVIRLIAAITPGFQVESWLAAFFGAFFLVLFDTLFRWLAGMPITA